MITKKDVNVLMAVKAILWFLIITAFMSVLVISDHIYFSFVVAKTAVFNLSVELMFVSFLALCWLDKSYALRLNVMVLLLVLHISILFLASWLGNDFSHSFWSNIERSEGLLLLIHLFLFVWVLASFIRSMPAWLLIFDLFILISLAVFVVSLDQYLALILPDFWENHVVSISPQKFNVRLSSTIGNPAYLAAYALFSVFLSIYLFSQRTLRWVKVYYGIVLVLAIFVILNTYTRGVFLALFIAAALFMLYLAGWVIKSKKLKAGLFGLMLLSTMVLISIFSFKGSDWVQQQPLAHRISQISFSDPSAINRMATWESAWQGIKQRPLLGYGQENFYQVFNRYYHTNNTEEWFDRAHNFIFDRAVTGGLLGLFSYLAMLFVPLWFAFRHAATASMDCHEKPALFLQKNKFFTPVLFSILIFAYLLQNLFIFETLVTYIPLMMVMAFLGFFSPPLKISILENEQFKRFMFLLGIILLVPALYYVNIKPLQANMKIYNAATSAALTEEQRYAAFEAVLLQQTHGNQEYRRLYFNLFENVLEKNSQNNLVATTKVMAMHLQQQIKENPHNVVNHLMLLRFCNYSHLIIQPCFDQALIAFAKAVELSPGRPQVYHEGAMSHFLLANAQASVEAMDLAVMNYGKAIDLYNTGVLLDQNMARRYDSMLEFLLAATTRPIFITTLLDRGVAGKSAAEFIAELADGIQTMKTLEQGPANENANENTKTRLATLKRVIVNILQIDPENLAINNLSTRF